MFLSGDCRRGPHRRILRQKARSAEDVRGISQPALCGSLTRILAPSAAQLRQERLRWNGVAPETGDSILLYVGRHPVFVVDAYTRPIRDRHAIVRSGRPLTKISGNSPSAHLRRPSQKSFLMNRDTSDRIVGSSAVIDLLP